MTEAFKDPSLPTVREIPSPFPADNLSSLHFGTPLALRQPSRLSGSGAVTQSARSFRQAFAENDIVRLAKFTGGVASLYEYHEAPLTRLLQGGSRDR